MIRTVVQNVIRLEELFSIYLSLKRFSNYVDRILDHMTSAVESLIDNTFDLINGSIQDELLEGEYRPFSEFGNILQMYIRTYKLMAKLGNEKIKYQLEPILLDILRIIVEVVAEAEEYGEANIHDKVHRIEELKYKLEELEKVK